MSHKTLTVRLIGFGASLVFTLLAFLIVFSPDFFHLSVQMAILAIFILAILQFAVQSICFLNVLGEKGPKWNLALFMATLSGVLLILVFTIWIMNHLNYNMMP